MHYILRVPWIRYIYLIYIISNITVITLVVRKSTCRKTFYNLNFTTWFDINEQYIGGLHRIFGTAVAQWLRRCATNRKVADSIPDGVIVQFFFHIKLPIALWPWGRLSFEQKWVPGVFPGAWRRPVRKANNLTTILGHCHEIWNLNFLEPSGPLQACNGTALPLLLHQIFSRTCVRRSGYKSVYN